MSKSHHSSHHGGKRRRKVKKKMRRWFRWFICSFIGHKWKGMVCERCGEKYNLDHRYKQE